jgi:hypothetical protein
MSSTGVHVHRSIPGVLGKTNSAEVQWVEEYCGTGV